MLNDLDFGKPREQMHPHLGLMNLSLSSTHFLWTRENDGIRHMVIGRLDQKPIHDWHVLYRIKNLVWGDHVDAFELYPSRDRLIDTGNVYHLWSFVNIPFKIGFNS